MADADLWGAVFAQALKDACETERYTPSARGACASSATCTAEEAEEAWIFLTAMKGEWHESRVYLAMLNNLDPDVVRQEALRRGPARALVAHMRGESPLQQATPRTKAILAAYAAGQPIEEIIFAYGITLNRLRQLASDMKVKRPVRAGSVAGELGGACDAAGGGNVSPSHQANLTQGTET